MPNWKDDAKDKLDEGKAKMNEGKGRIKQKADDMKNRNKKHDTTDNDNTLLDI